MSLASDSETTSVQAIEGSLQQEVLRQVRRSGMYRASETRRVLVALSLLCSDIISVFVAFSLVGLVFGLIRTEMANAALLVLPGIFWICGFYGNNVLTPPERMRRRLIGTIVFMATYLLISGEVVQSNLWLAVFVFLLGHYGEILTRHFLIRCELWGAPTAFAGRGAAIEQARHLLSAIPALGVKPIGSECPVEDLGSLADSELEFVVVGNKADFARVSKVARLFEYPPRVLLLQTEAVPARSFIGNGTISLAAGRNLNAPHSRLMKRFIDLVVGIPAMLIALPVIGVVALFIKLFSPGPAFYNQVRVGFNNRSFTVSKLRTMHCNAERLLEQYLHNNEAARLEWDRFCKLSCDPRILPYIGNIIRRISLDELPQIWQVVRGDISLIGPRPFPSYHTDLFDPAFQKLRSSVPPGLTGFWQVSSRSNGDIDVQKAQDLYYIRNWSIWLDLYILLQTIPAVIGARGDR